MSNNTTMFRSIVKIAISFRHNIYTTHRSWSRSIPHSQSGACVQAGLLSVIVVSCQQTGGLVFGSRHHIKLRQTPASFLAGRMTPERCLTSWHMKKSRRMDLSRRWLRWVGILEYFYCWPIPDHRETSRIGIPPFRNNLGYIFPWKSANLAVNLI